MELLKERATSRGLNIQELTRVILGDWYKQEKLVVAMEKLGAYPKRP